MIALEVPDMSCGHCVATITRAIKAADPDATLQFDLARHRVEIDSARADAAALRALVEAAGYTPAVLSA